MDDFFGDAPPQETVQETIVLGEAPPPAQNGILEVEDFVEEDQGGATLPPLSHMAPEESILLREWRRKKAIELEEKARISREKHDQVIADAKMELETFFHKREMNVSQSKANNKEKEKAYVENLRNINAKQGANYWESVCAFINFEAASAKKEKPKGKNEPVRSSVLLQEGKPGKHTDLARMRQVLLKLKHNPPKSFEAAKAASGAVPVSG